MQQSEMILYIIKLVLGGLAAFFAILLWSKTRDVAWMSLVAGTITSYAGIVYDMMNSFGLIVGKGLLVFGVPIASLLFASIPSLFYIAAFILMLTRNKRR